MEGEFQVHHLAFGLCLFSLVATVTSVHAGPRRQTTPVSYGASCIDGNNNAICGEASDTPLAQAIDANGLYFDTDHGSHSGLVLQGSVSLPGFTYIQVTRNITISGSLEVNKGDIGAYIQTVRGNISIAPRTLIVARNSLGISSSATTSSITMGSQTSVTLSGINAEIGIGSAGTLHVESGQVFKVSGSGSANVRLKGENGLQIDPGQTFSGTNRSGFYLTAGSDLNVTDLTCRTGYIIFRASGSAAHPGPRDIVIRNSKLTQTYRHGNLKIFSESPALGRIRLDHSTVVTVNPGGGIINPPATCVATTAPVWACQ
jgi:hypothetical protein